jgi:hypothetical protein
MSKLWKVSIGTSVIVVALLVVATISGWTTYHANVTAPTVQAGIDQKLPITKKGITVSRAVIKFDNHAEIYADITGKKLGKNFSMTIHTIGQPDLQHPGTRNGDFYFRATKAEILDFRFGDKAPEDTIKRFADRYVTNQGMKNLLNDAAPHAEKWMTEAAQEGALLALQHIPVYRLKNDMKGYFIGASVTDVSVIGDHLSITFSFWSLVGTVLMTLVAAALVIMLFIVFLVVEL